MITLVAATIDLNVQFIDINIFFMSAMQYVIGFNFPFLGMLDYIFIPNWSPSHINAYINVVLNRFQDFCLYQTHCVGLVLLSSQT